MGLQTIAFVWLTAMLWGRLCPQEDDVTVEHCSALSPETDSSRVNRALDRHQMEGSQPSWCENANQVTPLERHQVRGNIDASSKRRLLAEEPTRE